MQYNSIAQWKKIKEKYQDTVIVIRFRKHNNPSTIQLASTVKNDTVIILSVIIVEVVGSQQNLYVRQVQQQASNWAERSSNFPLNVLWNQMIGCQ